MFRASAAVATDWTARFDELSGRLAFVGLDFQYSVASSTLMGMDRDAAFVVDTLLGAPAAGRRSDPNGAAGVEVAVSG